MRLTYTITVNHAKQALSLYELDEIRETFAELCGAEYGDTEAIEDEDDDFEQWEGTE